MSVSSISGVVPPTFPSAAPPTPTAPPTSDSSAARAASPSTTAALSSSVLSSLTPSDRSLIAAATGVVISPDGTVVSGGEYAGSGGAAQQFISVIAAARQLGQVQGPITPAELASLFPPYVTSAPGATVVAAQVARALRQLSPGSDAPRAPGASLDERV